MKPFAYLSVEYGGKSAISETLISTFLVNDMEIVIVKTRFSFFEIIFPKSIRIARIKSSIIYAISDVSKLKDGIGLLSSMMWHMPVFHILISRKGFAEKIVDLFGVKRRDIFEIEKELEKDILCSIEPLDGVLQFYAEGGMRKIIIDAFPKLELDE